MTTASSTRRRSTRPSGDERELAILSTAERLLRERPLADISVDDLAKGAGLSRPTFYFYFPSKDAVLLTLFERVIVEADSALEAIIANPPADPKTLWRIGINVFVETFGAHRAVSLAADAARTNKDLRDLWSRFMQKWVEHITAVIETERARGAAPVTLPAHDLSAALNLLNEKVMLTSFADERPSVPNGQLLDTLTHIWVTSIYGQSS
ncbi:TetR/AcrR family transcriptional regulator [Mycobacterium nebraskense]|uniref:TetR family transcriptional regulator n=1 Tax=Mycobacterium nebraskense TaxID=244292 RepID=A0A0F5N4E1_9MYCO|nr:TetR/AcrR family transcriptional regulator [Mycobacterium nebraskense]KKC01730.1 TetR family transcriptional regulator [Mycobacterium nebraskense]KLO33924.1 TetR family transcriptional regulator [Mycobacterium nebraskense]MBI2694788.1 TetR/AcrR family transcriptional regulator [Mycobacterium nebraskense]MCV7116156.1 TetR/AcrR family transcriptional regulator [Mycobacterium nebraskense]ORW22631.1 TetR family transcriptional regulator [Mycobacterium nebraskense]